MRRRDVLMLLGFAAWPFTAHAQEHSRPVIGYLHPGSLSGSGSLVLPFRDGLREAGYIPGQNVDIEFRWADGHYARLAPLAADLVERGVAVIVAVGGDPAIVAAKAATTTIPIVFNTGSDPVSAGLVPSFNRPGGNMTGVGQLTGLLAQKQFELLSVLLPKSSVIALLVNPDYPGTESRWRELQSAARKFNREIHLVNARTESDLEPAFATFVKNRAEAFMIVGDPMMLSRRKLIASLAERYRIPAIYSRREFAEAGGLMSYGASLTASYRTVGAYTGRILKGTNPGDLPVQQLSKIELVINLKAAKALGIDIPRVLLARADQVIE